MTLKLPAEISWCVPEEIQSAVDENNQTLYPYVRIYRSTSETSGYELIKTDVAIATNEHPRPFILGDLCRDISFNKDFDIESYLKELVYVNDKAVLLTLGLQEPEKVELFSIIDENGDYRLYLDNILVYSTAKYANVVSGWQKLNYNIGDIVLNTTELPITYTCDILTTDLISNSVNYDSKNPYIKHMVISEINSQINGNWVNKWIDPTIDIREKDKYYYIVKYVIADKSYESKFYLTRKSLTPKEQRLVNYLKGWLTPWLTNCLTDDDIRAGMIFALQSLNIKSPVTYFTIETLPGILESVLMTGSAIFTMMHKYLGIAFTDVSYSDNGVAVTIDRGGKIQTSIDKAMAYYDKLIDVAKLHYIQPGVAVGSINLQVSLGGRMPSNLVGSLANIFNAIGR